MTVEGVRALDEWPAALESLRALHNVHGQEARSKAESLSEEYQGRRAAMVFEVVASRQRRYATRVLPMVVKFEQSRQASLESLARNGPGDGYGLRVGEAETIRATAAGLLSYCARTGLGQEAGVRRWAQQTAPFAHAPKLDPFVGCVSGIGPALFAYLRMRCGADAIKPDIRVRAGLNRAGFNLPNDEHAILIVASAVATELQIPLIVLDQLLWWQSVA